MKEQISALMDDELDLETHGHVLKALHADGEAAAHWATYHVIGDAMRGNAPLSADFQQRLMARIDAEPTVLAPRARTMMKSSRIWSAAASFAAVALVGWVVLQQQVADAPMPAATAVMAEAESEVNNVSADSVNAYLLAHHERSADSSIQTAYYVRPVAYGE